MNKAIENITKELKKIDIDYEITDNKNGVIFELFNEELNITIRYLIQPIDFDNDVYLLTIATNDILKVKNELNILKTINKFNWDNPIINYLVSDEQKVHIMIRTFDTLDSISDDAIGFVKQINDDLEKNYDKLMKSNWS